MVATKGALETDNLSEVLPVRDFYLGPWEDVENLYALKDALIDLGFEDGVYATPDVLFVTAERDYAYDFINRGGKAVIMLGIGGHKIRDDFAQALHPDVRISTFDNVRFVPQFLKKAVRDVVGNRMPEPFLQRALRENQLADAAELAAFRRGGLEWASELGLDSGPM